MTNPATQREIAGERGTHVYERCELCGCRLLRRAGSYASSSIDGRAHATRHHYVAQRFFDEGDTAACGPVFEMCPWNAQGRAGAFCYECHEMLLHNPVLLAVDIAQFAELIRRRGLNEIEKEPTRDKLAGRVQLLNEIIRTGLSALLLRPNQAVPAPSQPPA